MTIDIDWRKNRGDADFIAVRLGAATHVVEARYEGYAVVQLNQREAERHHRRELERQAEGLEESARKWLAIADSVKPERRAKYDHQAEIFRDAAKLLWDSVLDAELAEHAESLAPRHSESLVRVIGESMQHARSLLRESFSPARSSLSRSA